MQADLTDSVLPTLLAYRLISLRLSHFSPSLPTYLLQRNYV